MTAVDDADIDRLQEKKFWSARKESPPSVVWKIS
jgi:hypothetical protein